MRSTIDSLILELLMVATEVYIGPRLTCTPNGLVNSVRLIDISLDDYYEEEENQPTIKAVVLEEE